MDNWLALYIAVVWYCDITVEQAIKQLEGRQMLAPHRVGELERETIEKIHIVVSSRKFSNVDKLEKRYKMHRCDICKSIQQYGGTAMSVCGDRCKEMGISFGEYKKKHAELPQGEREQLRERKAKQNTNTAKSIMQALKAGEKVILTYEKRTQKVTIVSKNDRILTVKDEQGRIDTIHIADIVTKEAKIRGMGA